MPYIATEPKDTALPVDFVLITPEAYVDHPSYGHAIISRLVEAEGFSVAINSQPQTDEDFKKFAQPNIAFLISGGVVDSMVNNYTVSGKKRKSDVYSEGGELKRPDRALSVYSKTIKRLFPDSMVIIGGMEASLRRFAHYDYWADKVMPSILVDSKADLLVYGMGENPLWDILKLVKKNVPIKKIKNVSGTGFLSSYGELNKDFQQMLVTKQVEFCPSYEEVLKDKKMFIKAYNIQHNASNDFQSKPLVQKHRKDYVIINPPAKPLTQKQMDYVYSLSYMGEAHPSYKKGVPAEREVKFSIVSHRGCFGNCSFCALSFHQGKTISKRSKQSIVDEAKALTTKEEFKGYIHDIGGPTANFRNPACKNQEQGKVCKDKQCIGYKVCPNLVVDHSEYLDILRTVRNLEGIKKVFVRSGIRFDYLMYDKNDDFFKELVKYHTSGQLKVAPEHSQNNVLRLMNKPNFEIYQKFYKRFMEETKKIGKEQYLVPYLISSHPGCTMDDAIKLTEYLKSIGHMPEQVQDFYPTPSTRSTCMYYTGIDPVTGEEVYVPNTKEEKRTQRALLQYRKKKNKPLVDKVTPKYRKRTNKSLNHRKK